MSPAIGMAAAAVAPSDVRDPRYQAFWLLRLGYTLIPLTMGIDKFFNGLVYWPKYLADWIANILPACRRCNRRKRTKTEDEFRAWLRSRPTESAKATESGTPDALGEAEGPYRTAPSRALPRGTARSRWRSPSRSRQGCS